MTRPIAAALSASFLTVPLVALATLALTNHPVPAPAPAPAPVLVWFTLCPQTGYWGPYSTVDACRTQLQSVRDTCNQPLTAPHVPNPAFVAIAHICRIELNATLCACEADVVVPGRPTLPGYYTQRAAQ